MRAPIFFVALAVFFALGQGKVLPKDDDDDFLVNLCPNHESQLPTFVPHPYDCSKFYECDNGKSTLMKCPEGLAFNYLLSVCDYPDRANCINMGPQ